MKWYEWNWSTDCIIFALQNIDDLQQGLSIFEPENLLVKNSGKPKPMANYIPSCELIADILLRMDRCGPDGVLVRWHYCQNISIEEIAKGTHSDFYYIVKCMNRALRYMSGPFPKEKSYEEFISHRKQKVFHAACA